MTGNKPALDLVEGEPFEGKRACPEPAEGRNAAYGLFKKSPLFAWHGPDLPGRLAEFRASAAPEKSLRRPATTALFRNGRGSQHILEVFILETDGEAAVNGPVVLVADEIVPAGGEVKVLEELGLM